MTRLATPSFLIKTYTAKGARQPLTNWTLTFEASPSLDDNPVDITYTIGSGITVTDELNGEFTVEFATADTTGYPNVTTVLRYEVTGSSSEFPSVILSKGTLTIEPTFV